MTAFEINYHGHTLLLSCLPKYRKISDEADDPKNFATEPVKNVGN